VARTINELFNIPPYTCTPTPLEFSFRMLLRVLVFQLHLILIKLSEKNKTEGERGEQGGICDL